MGYLLGLDVEVRNNLFFLRYNLLSELTCVQLLLTCFWIQFSLTPIS